MKHRHRTTFRTQVSEYGPALATAVFTIVLVVFSTSFSQSSGKPFTSPETHFTDPSSSGLEIVPASGGSSPVPTCTASYTPSTIYPGQALLVQWSSTDATSRMFHLYRNGALYYGPVPDALSGAGWYTYDDVAHLPGVTERYDVVNGPGGTGWCVAYLTVVTPAAPTCTISVNPTTVNQPGASTLSWSSANAGAMHITSLSYVTPNVASSTSVAPAVTTTYTGTASNAYGTGTCNATLTVNRSCSFNGGTVLHGNATTSYQAATVPFGSSCVSQSRTCTDGTLSGTYAFGSCTVNPPASCTLDGQTVAHGASRTFYSQQTTAAGQLCSAVSQSRTCTNGTLSGSASYQYANCSCAASYSCSGSSITYTNTSCSTSTIANCAAPSYCTPGLSSCQWDPIVFTPSGTLTGHLQARPSIVRTGNATRLYWDVENAVSCTISGGGQTWNTDASGPSGVLTNAITQKTTYTLTCDGGGSNPDVSETVDVLIQPSFEEQ